MKQRSTKTDVQLSTFFNFQELGYRSFSPISLDVGIRGVDMSSRWNEISNDELLDYDGPTTAQIARYERIIIHRLRNAVDSMSEKLVALGHTLEQTNKTLASSIDRAIFSQENLSRTQKRQQRSLVLLTSIIALATVVYAGVTILQVRAQHNANRIQEYVLDLAMSESQPIFRIKTEDETYITNLGGDALNVELETEQFVTVLLCLDSTSKPHMVRRRVDNLHGIGPWYHSDRTRGRLFSLGQYMGPVLPEEWRSEVVALATEMYPSLIEVSVFINDLIKFTYTDIAGTRRHKYALVDFILGHPTISDRDVKELHDLMETNEALLKLDSGNSEEIRSLLDGVMAK